MPNSTTYPYNDIVRITDQIGSNFYQATGVLISPDEVLTVSHAVWVTGVGTATNIVVQPGYAGGATPYGSYTGTITHYNQISDANDSELLSMIPSDYAIIHLSTPVTGVTPLTLGADFAGGAVTVAGYPATSSQLVTQAENVTTGSYNLLDGQTLGAGSSGGPVYTLDAQGNAVIQGLVVAGDSAGDGYFAKITQAIRTQLQTWVAQDDVSLGGSNYLDPTHIWAAANDSFVFQLYETGLGRAPDLAGFQGFEKQLAAGSSQLQIAQTIAYASEFNADHAGSSSAAFVGSLYQAGLGRTPAPAELQGWVKQLDAGAGSAAVLLGIATSSEAAVHLAHSL